MNAYMNQVETSFIDELHKIAEECQETVAKDVAKKYPDLAKEKKAGAVGKAVDKAKGLGQLFAGGAQTAAEAPFEMGATIHPAFGAGMLAPTAAIAGGTYALGKHRGKKSAEKDKKAAADFSKIASAFVEGGMTADEFIALCKEAGLMDAAKSFLMGGMKNGIPMKGLLGNLGGESSYMRGMAGNMLDAGRVAGKGVSSAGKQVAEHAGRAAQKAKGFVAGGMENGIPMHGLGAQLAESNPLHGMGASMASSAQHAGQGMQQAGQQVAQRAGAAAQGARNFVQGGVQNGIPMQGLGQQMAASNPLHGMGQSLRQSAGALGRSGTEGRMMGGLRPAMAG